MNGTKSWEDFLRECVTFYKASEKLDDDWVIIEKDKCEGNTYLKSSKKIRIKFDELEKDELINIEYHVVYSISYSVPILYFKGYRCDGSMISLENAWQIFRKTCSNSDTEDAQQPDMLSILTQMDHPILFQPYLALHPCRTSQLLANSPKSKNFIVTFLSIVGPYVGLKLNGLYATHFSD